MSAGNWCLIESDPGVFTELIGDLGVKGIEVDEVYTLDSLAALGKVYGLIFLFKWTGERDPRHPELQADHVFFAKQVINNACATQAILNILLNTDVNLGEELQNFREFTSQFDAETKGLAISNSDTMRTVHNSFAKADSLVFDDQQKGSKSEDLFHFIGYVPIGGRVYELDGLKEGPIDLGPTNGDDWLSTVTPLIQERMDRYQQGSSEIRFNLMAMMKDRILSLEEEISAQRKMAESMGADGAQALQEAISHAERELDFHRRKRLAFQKENIRRKHNFIPLIHQLLLCLAERGQLLDLMEGSKEKVAAARQKKDKN